MHVLGIARLAPSQNLDDFDLRLVNCGESLEVLAARLCQPNAPRNWSLCLHGVPGTGKSQFARHLARRLGVDVIQQHASDVLSMWVGQSEKQIGARIRYSACAEGDANLRRSRAARTIGGMRCAAGKSPRSTKC